MSALPTELVYAILSLAASADPATAHRLAYVSRAVCRATAAARWHTVVLTSVAQLERFWLTLLAADDPVAQNEETEEDESIYDHPNAERTRFVSYPSARPGEYVRNLFIDTTPDPDPDPGSAPPQELDLLSRASAVQTEREAAALSAAAALATAHPSTSWAALQRLKLAPTRARARLSGLLEHLPALAYLALGSVEMQLFSPSMHAVSPEELMLVYDGNDALVALVLLSGVDEMAHWTADAAPTLGGIRRHLRRLHVVGNDPRSGLAGLPMPVDILEPLRAGSFSPGSLIHALSFTNPTPHSSDDTSPPCHGVTHLRYDTRKFSFRPSEIVAARLRPFVQELTIPEPEPSTAASPRQFTHTGPRHAAPPRGAGATSSLNGQTTIPPALHSLLPSSPAAQALHSWGAGGFQRLLLRWDTPTGPQPERDTSGWPDEKRDAWTAAPNGRQAAFQTEMADSLRTLYGWSGRSPNRLDATESVARILRGFSAADSAALQRIQERLGHPLTFDARPPAEFIRLGGQAAFTRAERLAIFLDRAAGGAGSWL